MIRNIALSFGRFALGAGGASVSVHALSLGIRMIFMLVMLKVVGVAEFGTFSLLTAVELVVIYMSGLEFHTFTTRRYARHPVSNQLRSCLAAHAKLMLVTLPLAAGITLLATFLLRIKLDLAGTLAFLVVVVSGSIAQELIRFMVLAAKPVQAVLVTFLRGAAWMPLMIPFLQENPIRRLLIFWAVFSVIGMAWAIWLMRDSISTRVRVRWDYLLRGVSASRNYFIMSSASVIQSNLERFVLQLMLGSASVGVFSFFQTLANTLQALVTSSVMNVHLGSLLSGFGLRRADRFLTLRRVSKHAAAIGSGLGALMVMMVFPLLAVIDRAEYRSMLWMLPVLLFGQLVLVSTQPIHLALYGAHQDSTLMAMSLGALGLSLVLNVLFVGIFDINGAVAAPVVVCTLLAMVRWNALRIFRRRGVI